MASRMSSGSIPVEKGAAVAPVPRTVRVLHSDLIALNMFMPVGFLGTHILISHPGVTLSAGTSGLTV